MKHVQCNARRFLPRCALWLVPNYTAWWQQHMCKHNLVRVVTWKWNGESKYDLEYKTSAPNHYTTRSHTWMNEWMNDAVLLTCHQKLTKSQFSPAHASTKRTEERKHNTESYRVREGSLVEVQWAVRRVGEDLNGNQTRVTVHCLTLKPLSHDCSKHNIWFK